MNIQISNNARYYMYGNKIYDALLDETFHKDEISLEYWINLLRENTIASYTHGIKSVDELATMVKEIGRIPAQRNTHFGILKKF